MYNIEEQVDPPFATPIPYLLETAKQTKRDVSDAFPLACQQREKRNLFGHFCIFPSYCKQALIPQTREDGTIESAVPLPAPFAGGSSGSTPFTPWPIH